MAGLRFVLGARREADARAHLDGVSLQQARAQAAEIDESSRLPSSVAAAGRSRGARSLSRPSELHPFARHHVTQRLAQDLLAAEEAGDAQVECAPQQTCAVSRRRRSRFATLFSASARCASSASRSRHSSAFPDLWCQADQVCRSIGGWSTWLP
jgi:hypothetical protein